MTDLTNLLLEWYAGFEKSNSIQTALMTVVGGGIMGAIGFFLIKLPIIVGRWLKRQLTTTLTFNSQAIGYGDYNQQQYIAFLVWLSESKWFKTFSRVITIESMDVITDGVYRVRKGYGPGIGKHLFRFNGKTFVADITEKESQGTNVSKFTLSVTCMGRSHKPITDLIDAFVVGNESQNRIEIYRNEKENWLKVDEVVKRPLDSVIVEDGIIEDIIEKIETFAAERDWYISMGINYKIAFLLYGIPGTGKTSLIRAIAGHLNRPIYSYTSSYDVELLPTLLAKAKGGVVCMEDLEAYGMASSRELDSGDVEKRKAISKLRQSDDEVTDNTDLAEKMLRYNQSEELPKLLNAIDGVIGLDDIILFVSSNHPERLDKALTRDGRIDFRIEIPPMSNDTIKRYAKRSYGEVDLSRLLCNNIPGATVQTAFNLNRKNYDGFVEYLNNHVHKQIVKVESTIDKVV